MSAPLRWWVTPGALLVLTGVLTLGSEPTDGDAGPVTEPQPRQAWRAPMPMPTPREVVARDAAGQRHQLVLGLPSQTLVLAFPHRLTGERVDLKLWRRIDGAREDAPWITLAAKVRPDGTVPMAGVVAGSYDIECTPRGEPTLSLLGVRSPGSVAFGQASPGR